MGRQVGSTTRPSEHKKDKRGSHYGRTSLAADAKVNKSDDRKYKVEKKKLMNERTTSFHEGQLISIESSVRAGCCRLRSTADAM